jgi:predicted peroxiredoxin
MPMRELTLLVATGDPERFHAALTFAATAAAGGGSVRLHLHEGAVALLKPPLLSPNDAARAEAGLPTLKEIWEEALGLGVAVSLCQSGLALSGLRLDDLDPRLEAQGPAGLLSVCGGGGLTVF